MAPGVQPSGPCIQALRYVVAPDHLGRVPTVSAVPFPHTGVARGRQPRPGGMAVTPAILSTLNSIQTRHSNAAFGRKHHTNNEVDLRIYYHGGGKFRLRFRNRTSGEIGDRPK